MKLRLCILGLEGRRKDHRQRPVPLQSQNQLYGESGTKNEKNKTIPTDLCCEPWLAGNYTEIMDTAAQRIG